MQLEMNDEQLKVLVGGAIASAMSPENRDKLIRDALTKLLSPEYGKQTPLQNSFTYAVQAFARDMIEAKFKDDAEFQAMIAGVINDGIQLALFRNREATVERIAKSVSEMFSVR